MKTLFEMAPLIVALSFRTRKKTLTKAIGPLAMSKRKTCGRYVKKNMKMVTTKDVAIDGSGGTHTGFQRSGCVLK
jgi:hypothetical protein